MIGKIDAYRALTDPELLEQMKEAAEGNERHETLDQFEEQIRHFRNKSTRDRHETDNANLVTGLSREWQEKKLILSWLTSHLPNQRNK
jgi:hypothetical protein